MQIFSKRQAQASMAGTAWRLALVTVLLAACSTPAIRSSSPQPDMPAAPGVLAQDAGDCGPCCGRNPAADAGATQGVSAAYPANPYVGKDRYDNVIVGAGVALYSLTPGMAPGFAVAEQTLRDAGGRWEKYYDLVQVTTDPGRDDAGVARKLRDKVQVFYVIEPLCAARGTAMANPQFGSGGGVQYYVSRSDVRKLRPGAIVPISQWRAASADKR